MRKPPGVATAAEFMAQLNTPENRQGVDDLNEIMEPRRRYSYTVDNLGMFARLLASGYTREDWLLVLSEIKQADGGLAEWCRVKKPPLVYILRPGEEGAFARIIHQASESMARPVEKKMSSVESAESALRRRAGLEELPF